MSTLHCSILIRFRHEHWGTTFFTPKGILSDRSDKPRIISEIENFVPYQYRYTPLLEVDHHVDRDDCPKEAA